MKRIRFGSHEFDPVTGELFCDGRQVKLQPQPSRVLALLLAHPGEVVSREQLRDALWPDGTTVEFDQGLNYCIRQIRSALGESASDPEFIETLPKKGYRFIAAIDRPEEASSAPLRQSALPRSGKPWWAGALVLISLVLMSLLLGWNWYSNRIPAAPKSILIQPFVPMGMAEAEAWYGDAIARQLIRHLAKTNGLRVLPWSASDSLRGQKLSTPEVARSYGVEAVLEGSVSKREQRLIVTAQLVDAASQQVIWTYRDDRAADDLGKIESAITASLAAALRFRIVEGEKPLARRRPEDPETYNLYLKGLAMSDQLSANGSAAAVEAFEEVIRRTPSFAPAYVGLANVLVLETFTRGKSKEANLARALALASRALELDPESGDAHGARAHALFNSWHWVEADQEFQTALRLDPDSASTLQLYAIFLATQRRFDEAAKALRHAEVLAPTSSLIATTQCRVAFYAQRFDEAITACEKALLLDKGRSEAWRFLGRIYILKGMFREAKLHFERWTKPKEAPSEALWRAYLSVATGDPATARAMILAWEKTPRTTSNLPLPYALTKLRLHQEKAGFAALRALVDSRITGAIWLKATPELAPYQNDPRFLEVAAQLGFD